MLSRPQISRAYRVSAPLPPSFADTYLPHMVSFALHTQNYIPSSKSFVLSGDADI